MLRKWVVSLMLPGGVAVQAAEDARLLAKLPARAEATLREEMRDNLLALNQIVGLLASGNVKQAGEVAEHKLGLSATGQNRNKPLDARPGAHMPEVMHGLAMDGHKAASEFARIAAGGDRDKAMGALPAMTSACVACHYSYRIR